MYIYLCARLNDMPTHTASLTISTPALLSNALPRSRSTQHQPPPRATATATQRCTMPSAMAEPAVFPPTELREIANEVAALLKDRNETISVGETAAGGLISAALLSVPGASQFYRGGMTLYTLESRVIYGGWTQKQVDEFTGPSIYCVLGLAEHMREKLSCTYAIAESGCAGPTNWGKTRNMQPGYVALAVASGSGCVEREVDTESNDREANMVLFAVEALKLVKDVINADMARFSGWLNC